MSYSDLVLRASYLHIVRAVKNRDIKKARSPGNEVGHIDNDCYQVEPFNSFV